jgi:hypothetical protein
MSINRQDCGIRSYDPQDGNVEVGEMSMVCVCVYLLLFFTAVHVRVCQLFVGQHATRHDPEPEDVSYCLSLLRIQFARLRFFQIHVTAHCD